MQATQLFEDALPGMEPSHDGPIASSTASPRSTGERTLQEVCHSVKASAQTVLAHLAPLQSAPASPSRAARPSSSRFLHLTLDVPDQARVCTATPFSAQSPRAVRPSSTSRNQVNSPKQPEVAPSTSCTDTATSSSPSKAYLVKERVSELLGVFTSSPKEVRAGSPSHSTALQHSSSQGGFLSPTKSIQDRQHLSGKGSRPFSANVPASPRALLSPTNATPTAAQISTPLSNRPSSDYAESCSDTYLSERESSLAGRDSCLPTPSSASRPAQHAPRLFLDLQANPAWPGADHHDQRQPHLAQHDQANAARGKQGALLKSPSVAPWDAHTDAGGLDELQEYVHSMDGTARRHNEVTGASSNQAPPKLASSSPPKQEPVLAGPAPRNSNSGVGARHALGPQPPATKPASASPMHVTSEVKRPVSQQGRLARVWHRKPAQPTTTRPGTAATIEPTRQVDNNSLTASVGAQQPRPHTAAECVSKREARLESPRVIELDPVFPHDHLLRSMSAGGIRAVKGGSAPGTRPATVSNSGLTSPRSPLAAEVTPRPGSSGSLLCNSSGPPAPGQTRAQRRTASPMAQRSTSQGSQMRRVAVITPVLDEPPGLERPGLYGQILLSGLEPEEAQPAVTVRIVKPKPTLCSVSPYAWSINRSTSAPHGGPEASPPLLFGRMRQTDGGRWVPGLPSQLYMVNSHVTPTVPDSLVVSQMTVFAPKTTGKAVISDQQVIP